MIDPITLQRWIYRFIFALVGVMVMFFALLPFNIGMARLPAPDIVLLIAFAWVLRRPDYMPALLAAVVLLTEDILFMRPLGLWSGLGLMALEFFRAREPMWRDLPFMFEWAMVAAVLLAMTLAQTAILGLFLVEQPGVQAILTQASISILCYPFITGLSRLGFRVAKPAPGEVDALGHKL